MSNSNEVDVQKALGQFGMAMQEVLEPIMEYGHQDYVPSIIQQSKYLALQFHRRLSGEDTPISVNCQLELW